MQHSSLQVFSSELHLRFIQVEAYYVTGNIQSSQQLLNILLNIIPSALATQLIQHDYW